MISVAEALRLVQQHAPVREAHNVPLVEALGRHLAEDVVSDVDSPPHNKAMVDGYAVQAADLSGGTAELQVLEEVTAGDVPTHVLMPGCATRIMTGAPVPEGADSIVMIEQSEAIPELSTRVRLHDTVKLGQHIMPLATVLTHGERVLASGKRIRPSDVGLLAEVGCSTVNVIRQAQVAILSTGNELVPPSETPRSGQIRNSNGPMLQTLVVQAGASPLSLGVARDDEHELERLIRRGLEADVLLLSGGVSAGVLDLVPSTLEQLSVRRVFHKVQLKPGKPLWFGIAETSPRRTLVFGLPGNPVSSLVCFELFVRQALRMMHGNPIPAPAARFAVLMTNYEVKGNRDTYFPGVLQPERDRWHVHPVAWLGSADQKSVADANCLIVFRGGEPSYAAGDSVEVIRLFDD